MQPTQIDTITNAVPSRSPNFKRDLSDFLAEPPAFTLTPANFLEKHPKWACSECAAPASVRNPQSQVDLPVFQAIFEVDESVWTSLRKQVVRVAIEHLGWGCWDFIRYQLRD